MSGQQVPYQLRTNKFVERQLFLDVLDFVRLWNGPSEYVYVSMGGLFLEDFKQINSRFAIENMVSLESDERTWERQRFNSPYGFIECRCETSGEFIAGLDRFIQEHVEQHIILWLDYTDPKERFEQLQEYEAATTKLGPGDVIKITLNGNYQSSMKRSEYRELSDKQYDTLLLTDLTEQLNEYVPEGGMSRAHLNEKAFAQFLMQCVEMAALRATENSELIAVPLLACRYKDGEHQMVTITTIICTEDLAKSVSNDRGFNEWIFRPEDWRSVFEVRVPILSPKELLSINHLMKKTENAYEIHKEIGIHFDDHDGESIALVRNYLRHYRRYPSFGRIQ